MIRYIIISPVRDEEAYLEKTVASVVSQTIRPAEWIIVNDGSTDSTGALADKYAGEVPWIKALHRADRGFRKAGGGVIEAFYDGYDALTCADWDFVVKLDGDLSFQPDYFEECLKRLAANPKLGVGGGMIYNVLDGGMQWEPHPMFHVRGATKIYKRKCWEAIGGLIAVPGWDTLDEAKANMLGWETATFPDIKIVHHRITGAADGTWRDSVKNGLSDYISGYHPLFMVVKCLKRLGRKPFVIGSAGLLCGFFSGYMNGVKQVDDAQLIRYIRHQQLRRLFLKSSIWQ